MDNTIATLTPPSTPIQLTDDPRPPQRLSRYQDSGLILSDMARSTVLFTSTNHFGDLIAAYPELEGVCAEIGFGSGAALGEWCAKPDWALLVLARAALPPAPSSRRDWSLAYLPGLIPHIIELHHKPLRNELRRLSAQCADDPFDHTFI